MLKLPGFIAKKLGPEMLWESKFFPTLLFVAVMGMLMSGCSRKDPCFEQWGVSNCHELFDLYQAHITDMEKGAKIKKCYDLACR